MSNNKNIRPVVERGGGGASWLSPGGKLPSFCSDPLPPSPRFTRIGWRCVGVKSSEESRRKPATHTTGVGDGGGG